MPELHREAPGHVRLIVTMPAYLLSYFFVYEIKIFLIKAYEVAGRQYRALTDGSCVQL